MTTLAVDQEIEPYRVKAKNFATESENKIHSDDVAAQFGFKGGLVPGVGVFAYMTVPAVKALGREFLEHGAMSAKFIKPVYDEEWVTVTAKVVSAEPPRIVLSVLDKAGELCAVGEASIPEKHPHVNIAEYPYRPLPEPDDRLPAEIEALADGLELGSLEFTIDPAEQQGEHGNILDDVQDDSPIYRGADAATHPALVTFSANYLLKENVDLGPWIHTASDVRYMALPKKGETVYLNGKVAHSYKKRGHEIVVLDLVLMGDNERVLAHLTHTAIVKPHQQSGNGAG